MGETRILIVEDDESIARFMELELTHNGYVVEKVHDGASALEAVETAEPDLLILDLMLPGVEGIDVARTLREHGFAHPILMVTARAETHDVVSGFDAGADDYLRKPFEMPELLSRVGALLKRVDHQSAHAFSASGVEVDTSTRTVRVEGDPVELTAREFDLLSFLVTNAGRVVTREEIVENVWGGQREPDSNVIEVFMCHLRGKIGDRGAKVIQTIRGVGYFFARG